MKIVWLSANLFGYRLLSEARKVPNVKITVVTLSELAKTRMYDGIDRGKWRKLRIPVYEIENVNESVDLLRKLAPDLIIMCGWRQIIGKEVLELPKLGVVGFHPTLLPIGRGPAPIINTILEGIRTSGVTMFYISDSVDSGDIIAQSQFSVEDDDYAWDVYRKAIRAGRELVDDNLPPLMSDTAMRMPQDECRATHFKKRTIADNEILPNDTPLMISRKIRAFSKPYDGAFITLGGKKVVIWREEDFMPAIMGEIK